MSTRLVNTSANPSAPSRVYSFKVMLRQLDAMRKVEQRTGATVAEQIRRGIDLWLKQQEAGR